MGIEVRTGNEGAFAVVMAYDPNSMLDRCALAAELRTMLLTAGFAKLEDQPLHSEDVYRYQCIGGTEIIVYSSIVASAVRGDGEDAIRVAAVYRRKDGQTRGLFKDTRVNRTGTTEKIVDRTKERMRNAYKAIKAHWVEGRVCRDCGAPQFLSKGGKWTCAETCWVAPKGAGKK
jgi:hypothetical protein